MDRWMDGDDIWLGVDKHSFCGIRRDRLREDSIQ